MGKNTDLKSYLHLWKDHFMADVEGQSSEVSHLDEAKLMQMAKAGGVGDASQEDIEHLSTCPTCLEDWSALSKESVETVPVSYGVVEDDVFGQSENLIVKSSCEKFTLTLSPDQQNPNHGTVSLKVHDLTLANTAIRVRDRNGLVMIEGTIKDTELLAQSTQLNLFDLSIWTVLKKTETHQAGE